jgi:gliding motility-associated-like protein
MYISSPSIIPINFQVKTPIGGILFKGTVSRDDPYEYTIGSGNDTQFMIDKSDVNTIKNNKGFIVEAEDLVYVTVRVVATTARYQAGSIVSKGQAALGKQFRIGAFTNKDVTNTSDIHYTFATILATENTTTISFGDIKTGVSLINNATVGNTPSNIILNRGESFAIAVEGPNDANRDGLIGASITSDKPIVVNCGSFGGSNSTGNLDLGMDQIVSAERTGTEYIFIKGNGNDLVEKPIIVANENSTEVFLNGSTTALTTLSAGQYVALNGNDFSAYGNLYVTTSKKAFAYQGIGGTSGPQNQNLHFVPPLNCGTPKIINNIPLINTCGIDDSFTGTVCIVTKTGSVLNFIIDAVPYTLATLPSTNPITGPSPVTGNPDYKTYTISGLTGNVSVFSTSEVYLSYFGSSGAATYGGFYSGFTFDPEITFGTLSTTVSECIPNVNLSVNTLSSFDSLKWFKDGVFTGITASSYTPSSPGYYYVSGQISACGISSPPYNSVEIPVSSCPTDLDNDSVNDNIDIDNDNDGITNCTESYGDQQIDISTPTAGNISIGSDYSNPFTGVITTTTTASATPFTGNSDGSFVSEVPAGIGNSVTYKMTFTQTISLGIEYVNNPSNPLDLLNSNAEYILNSDEGKTITVLNPSDQLLIDTNYDGVYESGVKQFSSFEIRFQLKSTTPLAAGTGTFKFLTYLTKTIQFTHKNLSDTDANKSTLKFFAVCVPKDSDLDGIADQLDLDSDNDGIPDSIEVQGNTTVVLLNADTNKDGLDNAFEPGFTPVDTDNDLVVPDYLDLDSDNDGILDSVETGNDLDADGIRNYRDLDSDDDGCADVVEAGFKDPDGDGKFENSPITVDLNGRVNGAPYTAPINNNYITSAPITIITEPAVSPTCELQNATITIVTTPVDEYQWQVSTDGITWNDIIDNATYSGAKLKTLSITSVTNAMDSYKYCVKLSKDGNFCGLISQITTLTVYPLPIVNPVTIIQCDDDADGTAQINLKNQNSTISINYKLETFKYYTSPSGATDDILADLIENDSTYVTKSKSIWSRIINIKTGCFSVAEVTIIISAPKISPKLQVFPPKCDDDLDINGINNSNNNKRDGIATFDFSSATANLGLATGYSVTYYRKKEDAESELDPILDPSNYRNIEYPDSQNIWGRVNSPVDNSCFGLGHYVTLTVEKLPFANPVSIPTRQCDDNQDGIYTFDTSLLEDNLLLGQTYTDVTVTYFDQTGSTLKSPFPPSFTTKSQTIKAVVTNNTTLKCSDETLITFTVDDLPEAFPIPVSLTTTCDDEVDPLDQDGKFTFDTSTFEATILGIQNGMTVTYSLQDGTVLSTLAPSFTTGTQDVIVKVTNPINTSCSATTILNFVVNPLPNINLNTDGSENELVCQNNTSFIVPLDAGIQAPSLSSDYDYIWSRNTGIITGEINPILHVNLEGTYTVEVISKSSGCSRTRTIKVTASDKALIGSVDIVDLTNINTVTVNATGLGDYVYSLDYPNAYQAINIFTDVPAGIHTVYVKDLNGCGTSSQVISVIGIPPYFTPNADGINDTWNVKGLTATNNYNTTIYIFDRYGKLLKQLGALETGWDGTFNGNMVPSDDYWYTIYFEDGRTAKGNFTLKR